MASTTANCYRPAVSSHTHHRHDDGRHGHAHHRHSDRRGHEPHRHLPTTARRFLATLGVTAIIMIAEVVGGLWSGSLALLADAGHMLTDLLALLVAFAAAALAALPADDRRTYGYRRLEILAALVNGVALVVVSGSIVVEALHRWVAPRPIDTQVMSAVAALGLAANLVGLWLLGGHRNNLNVRGAFLHMLGDAFSSVGVLAAAGVVALTGWGRADAVVSLLIGAVIVVTSFSLLREVVEVLLEATPRGIDTEKVRRCICAVDGVDGVFDLHIWSITSEMPALSAHVVVTDPAADRDALLRAIQHELARMDMELECARLAVYNAARLKEAGKPFAREGAIAKLKASEVAEYCTSKGLELLGGYGYVKDYPLEKMYRDAKIGKIYEGTSYMQLSTIAKDVLKRSAG